LLALGDGVGLLCDAGLLPGGVTAAATPATHVRIEGRATPFTWAIPAGRILALETARDHAYVAPDDDVAALVRAGRVVMSYCDSSGGLVRGEAGAQATRVAGLCDESGRVVGVLGGLTEALSCALGRQIALCLEGARPSP
jgi:phosphoribosylformylglycinamidine (FGAM) synthase-like amidotransferase family enzyme